MFKLSLIQPILIPMVLSPRYSFEILEKAGKPGSASIMALKKSFVVHFKYIVVWINIINK